MNSIYTLEPTPAPSTFEKTLLSRIEHHIRYRQNELARQKKLARQEKAASSSDDAETSADGDDSDEISPPADDAEENRQKYDRLMNKFKEKYDKVGVYDRLDFGNTEEYQTERMKAWKYLANSEKQEADLSNYDRILLTTDAIARILGFFIKDSTIDDELKNDIQRVMRNDKQFEKKTNIWWLNVPGDMDKDDEKIDRASFYQPYIEEKYTPEGVEGYARAYYRLVRLRNYPRRKPIETSVYLGSPFPDFPDDTEFRPMYGENREMTDTRPNVSFYAKKDGITASYRVIGWCVRSKQDFIVGAEKHGDAKWYGPSETAYYIANPPIDRATLCPRLGLSPDASDADILDALQKIEKKTDDMLTHRYGAVFYEESKDYRNSRLLLVEDGRSILNGKKPRIHGPYPRSLLVGKCSTSSIYPDLSYSFANSERPTEFLKSLAMGNRYWGNDKEQYELAIGIKECMPNPSTGKEKQIDKQIHNGNNGDEAGDGAEEFHESSSDFPSLSQKEKFIEQYDILVRILKQIEPNNRTGFSDVMKEFTANDIEYKCTWYMRYYFENIRTPYESFGFRHLLNSDTAFKEATDHSDYNAWFVYKKLFNPVELKNMNAAQGNKYGEIIALNKYLFNSGSKEDYEAAVNKLKTIPAYPYLEFSDA